MKDELTRLIDRLLFELAYGQLHIKIAALLDDDLATKPYLWKIAPTFFFFTLKAHFDAAVMCLAKVFDSHHPRAVSLTMLLKCANSNQGRFNGLPKGEVSKFVKGQRLLLQEMESKAKAVLDRRNQRLAHLDPFPKSAKELEVKFDEAERLYEDARMMLNTISKAYRGKNAMLLSEAERVQGWDDYHNLINLIERENPT